MNSRKITRWTKYKNKDFVKEEDFICEEILLDIQVNGEKIATIATSPWELEEMGTGFLFFNGLIEKREDLFVYELIEGKKTLFKAEILEKEIKRREIVENSFTLSPKKVYSSMEELTEASKVFHSTGGVHNAALFNEEGLALLKMDIGRHNTLDRLMGHVLLKNYSLENHYLVFSGRLASEIILKTIQMNLPIIISPSAPTTRSVELGEKGNLTMIGFTREERFSIYSHKERINH